jgi:hypothetical protein
MKQVSLMAATLSDLTYFFSVIKTLPHTENGYLNLILYSTGVNTRATLQEESTY